LNTLYAYAEPIERWMATAESAISQRFFGVMGGRR
jgi:hypothetical protein